MGEATVSEFLSDERKPQRKGRMTPSVNPIYCFECIKSIEKIISEATPPKPKLYVSWGDKQRVRLQRDNFRMLYITGMNAFDNVAKESSLLLKYHAAAEICWVEDAAANLKIAYEKFIDYSKKILC